MVHREGSSNRCAALEARPCVDYRRPWQLCALGIVSLGLVVEFGCGGENRLSVAPVRGRVVFEGQGVPDASVLFFPVGKVAEQAGKLRPFADTDAEGRFVLKTYVGGDGAPLGDYRVSIVVPTSGTRDAGERAVATGGDIPAPSAGPDIPLSIRKKFADRDTSGITVRVRPGENDLEPFVLH